MARNKPAPISLKKPRPKKAATKPVEPFNMDAPEHKEPRIVQRIVKDKALERRVAQLEGAEPPEIIVNVEAPAPRPRITEIAIKYDNFGAPIRLIPAYGE